MRSGSVAMIWARRRVILEPLLDHLRNLAKAGAAKVGTFVADTGYWSVDSVSMKTDAEVLITPMQSPKGSPTRTTDASLRARRSSGASARASSA